MTLSAWIMMLVTMLIVTGFTLYFFIKVLRIPSHSPQDQISRTQELNVREEVVGSSHTDEPIPLA